MEEKKEELIERWVRITEEGLRVYAPWVRITPECLADLRLFTLLAPKEISGVGMVKVEGRALVIHQLFIFPQQCSALETILDDETDAIFLESLTDEEVDELRLWWHSHGWFALGWSTMDRDTIERRRDADFWVSIVLDKHKRERVRVDFYRPFRITVDWLPLLLTKPVSREEFRQILKARLPIIKQKIQENVHTLSREEADERAGKYFHRWSR